MLFKFASYLLGTNNDTEETRSEGQQLNTEGNENTQEPSSNETNLTRNEKVNEEENISKQQDLIEEEEEDYMYAEQLINCSKLKNSNCELIDSPDLSKDDHLCDQLEDEDCEDDQWIYITPIKRKNEEGDKNLASGQEKNCVQVDGEEKGIPPKEQNVPINPDDDKEKFNFYDYFNNKSSLTTLNEDQCSPVKSSKLSHSKTNKKFINVEFQQQNRMEESWVIHPPACFQLDNTFSYMIEEHPLENLYIENPQVMASCKSLDKENASNASSLTNSSSLLNKPTGTNNRILVDRNVSNQAKESATSRKSMRKRANSTRKTGKKQITSTKKSKSQSMKADLTTTSQQPIAEQVAKEEEGEQKQVLNDRQTKQLLARYLRMNPILLSNAPTTTSNTIAPIASSSNGSTHHTANHSSHNHSHHHYLSNNSVATFNASTNVSAEPKKGSKSLRRNNKVALKRDNLSNKPFTLHRKLC